MRSSTPIRRSGAKCTSWNAHRVGAFARTPKSRGLRRIPMLFQHDPAEPIGVWFELTEDFRGLRARGKLIPEVARARELYALVTSGAVDGLSIGFRTEGAHRPGNACAPHRRSRAVGDFHRHVPVALG